MLQKSQSNWRRSRSRAWPPSYAETRGSRRCSRNPYFGRRAEGELGWDSCSYFLIQTQHFLTIGTGCRTALDFRDLTWKSGETKTEVSFIFFTLSEFGSRVKRCTTHGDIFNLFFCAKSVLLPLFALLLLPCTKLSSSANRDPS